MRTKTRVWSVTAALALVVCASTAAAQEEPSAADVSAARALGQEGVKLADAGNCEEAIDRLTRAEKIFHAPSTQARLGECQVKVGKIVAGTETLNRVVRETLAPNAPQAFRDAQERAKTLLAEAKPKIAKLKIAVAAPADAKLVVTIDGENLPLANLNMNRPVDPGEHVVRLTAPRHVAWQGTVVAGDAGIVEAKVPPLAEETVEGPPAPATLTTTRKIGIGVAGLGVVALGVGSVFGLMAVSKKSEATTSCGSADPKTCQVGGDIGLWSDAKTLGNVSTVTFIAGGALLAGAAALWFLGAPSRSAPVVTGGIDPSGGGSLGLRGVW